MVEQEAGDHRVERVIGEGQPLCPGQDDGHAGGTGDGNHGPRLIDADHLCPPIASTYGHQSGAGGHVAHPGPDVDSGGVEEGSHGTAGEAGEAADVRRRSRLPRLPLPAGEGLELLVGVAQ